MTAQSTIYQFFSSIMTAYPSTSVPINPTFPYMTYELPVSHFNEGEVSAVIDLWYRTTSEAEANEGVRRVSEALGNGGKLLKCDEGVIWLKRGSPFAQPLYDETDSTIKRRMINIDIEYLTI